MIGFIVGVLTLLTVGAAGPTGGLWGGPGVSQGSAPWLPQLHGSRILRRRESQLPFVL